MRSNSESAKNFAHFYARSAFTNCFTSTLICVSVIDFWLKYLSSYSDFYFCHNRNVKKLIAFCKFTVSRQI